MKVHALMCLMACSSAEQEPPTSPPTFDAGSLPEIDADTSPGDAAPEATRPATQLVMMTGSGDGNIRTFMVEETPFRAVEKGAFPAGQNPSFLAFDAVALRAYAVNEGGTGMVRAFSFDPALGSLAPLGAAVSSGGSGPTHLSLTPRRSHVLVANYTAGSVAVLPIASDGSLEAATDVKMPGSKAHLAITNPGGEFAYVPCLGSNFIAQYTLSNGMLTPLTPATVSLPAGSGPRHMVFRPDEKFAYGLNELTSTVTSFAFEKATGQLRVLKTITTLPSDFAASNTGAEIFLHPTGKWLYASNRGHNSIAAFAVDPSSGELTLVQHVGVQGNTPRSFAVDPEGRWLVAANQGSSTLNAFSIDALTGKLTSQGTLIAVPSPAFVGLYRVPK